MVRDDISSAAPPYLSQFIVSMLYHTHKSREMKTLEHCFANFPPRQIVRKVLQ